ncbi:ABC transporter ATP-binding protein [Companilactobacillus sp.]|jgi:iron(III) transport system ATP-binding protein|uniref:ABC transporter ATP-binding protein n=1 Tax=Companilactobacillus sp. TaxID=2767905 RepID=UPI0025C1ACCD|nr:ABC transporter ATP-binding protein [Companilactobacillus sp.]MCH4009273.1 ABC transporter ATP-binding protein [Companilactobacillus sp.]MCH4050548.1 ABC transporter ATP-binding protein [Companilactobacillus sp.]MCH4077215.1 ABC transporter ATP-binding protein [Companilactobacillus sp.]MCH4125791.1 ABC transporter ATP-binding protein [Companilactobacillus sp.]MCI1311500.1 ABC transporter ATP-binding protein [Companilactobacillus sp.]
MFLEVENLTKKYSKTTVLHSLSFGVEQNKILVVLGPSGCGKSTLLSCLNGFTDVDAGTVKLDQTDITNLTPEDRDITTVFQSYSLFPNMNVLQNLMYGLKFKKIKRAQAKDKALKMLHLLQMDEFAESRIQDLSGGQQQRIALGRSLIVEPKLLLLDEPFSNLDEKLRLTMRQELRRIQEELNITMVFVTHDQQEAFSIGDSILVMDHGRIQQITTGEELYSHPNNLFVLKFIGESNLLDDGQYIRPENIQLQKNESGSGIITDVNFQGSTIDYTIKYQEHNFQVTCLNQGQPFNIGEHVDVKYQISQLEDD